MLNVIKKLLILPTTDDCHMTHTAVF